MINFNKNKLINKTLIKYYETFNCTLDTADFVPEKFNLKISNYIYKNMKKAFKQIDKEDRVYQKDLLKKQKLKKKEQKQPERKLKKQEKLNKPKRKFVMFFKTLFLRSKLKRSAKDTDKPSS